MSIEAMNWAFDSGLPPGARFVLVYLGNCGSNHCDEDWSCFPSILKIMKKTGQGRSTVEKHLTWLWREGWISREPRVRPDGTLGINDYVLHSRPETRADLKVERAEMEHRAGRRRASKTDAPSLKSRDGPSLKSRVSIPRNETQPSLDLKGHEPSDQSKGKPTHGAREPGDEGFERLIAVWHRSGLKRTKWPQARTAFAYWAQRFGVEPLVEAAKACVADPDLARGDYGWPGLHTWLSEERFRSWLGRDAGGSGEAASCAPRFPGPAILRFEVAQAAGEDTAGGYLDLCGWDPETSTVRAKTTVAFDRLKARAGEILTKHGATLAPPGGA